jgi:hypothetical protein
VPVQGSEELAVREMCYYQGARPERVCLCERVKPERHQLNVYKEEILVSALHIVWMYHAIYCLASLHMLMHVIATHRYYQVMPIGKHVGSFQV